MIIRSLRHGCMFAVLWLPLSAVQAAEVEWVNVVNAAAIGNSLVKTGGCNGCDDAGAQSSQQLDAGNVYVEFVVPDVAQALVAGFGNEGEGTAVTEIDFGIRIQDGMAEAIENGFPQAAVEAANGDRFRVSLEDGVVSYFRNDMGFHTSSRQPEYPLRIDVTLLGLNARLDNVVAVPFGAAAGEQQAGIGQTVALQWTEVVNASVEGDALVKTGGCDGCEDAGARSVQAMEEGNVYVEFSIPDASKLLWVGLTNERTGMDDAELDFAIRVQNRIAEVRENGEYQAGVEIADGDTFRISVENGVVSYFHNGEGLHTSARPAEYPLFLATTLGSAGAAVANARAVAFGEGVAALSP